MRPSDFSAWPICSWRSILTISIAAGSAAVPDSTTQLELSLSASQAARALADVPSTSIDWCCTGRPLIPPLVLMSCQAAREPMRKSFETSCCSGETSTIWAMVTVRVSPGFPGLRAAAGLAG
jgi:hypothetical protein